MGKAKKNTLTPIEIIEITKALNENITANESKSQEDRIPTDKFILNTFNISRKKFSQFIKNTSINYNPSTHLYDIPQSLLSNTKLTPDKIKNEPENIKAENKQKNIDKTAAVNIELAVTTNNNTAPAAKGKPPIPTPNFKGNNLVTTEKDVSQAVITILNKQYPKLDDMLAWYRKQKDRENIIEVPEIDVNREELSGELVTRSFKTYEKVLDKFKDFCKTRKETQKDLIALALCEFMDRYK